MTKKGYAMPKPSLGAYRGTLQVVFPANGQEAVPAGPLEVVGYWTAPGQPEPDPPTSITIQHGSNKALEAKITRTSLNSARTWIGTFQSPEGSIIVAPGPNAIIAVGTDDFGSRRVEVIFSVGGPPPLDTQFIGTATLTTNNSNASGPFVNQIDISLSFSSDRKTVTITNFPSISTSFTVNPPWPLPPATDTVTISLTGGGIGSFDPQAGTMIMPVTLFFHNSYRLAGDSTLTLSLSTAPAPPGSPLKGGNITLVGTGTFTGGFLGGSTAKLVLAGTINPSP